MGKRYRRRRGKEPTEPNSRSHDMVAEETRSPSTAKDTDSPSTECGSPRASTECANSDFGEFRYILKPSIIRDVALRLGILGQRKMHTCLWGDEDIQAAGLGPEGPWYPLCPCPREMVYHLDRLKTNMHQEGIGVPDSPMEDWFAELMSYRSKRYYYAADKYIMSNGDMINWGYWALFLDRSMEPQPLQSSQPKKKRTASSRRRWGRRNVAIPLC